MFSVLPMMTYPSRYTWPWWLHMLQEMLQIFFRNRLPLQSVIHLRKYVECHTEHGGQYGLDSANHCGKQHERQNKDCDKHNCRHLGVEGKLFFHGHNCFIASYAEEIAPRCSQLSKKILQFKMRFKTFKANMLKYESAEP